MIEKYGDSLGLGEDDMGKSIITILLISLAVCTFGCEGPQPETFEVRTAWIFCVDTSRSPRADQFAGVKKILQTITQADVTYNDVVWLLKIGDAQAAPAKFRMPSEPFIGTKSAEKRLAVAKQSVVTAIGLLQQDAPNTPLCETVERAVIILQNQRTDSRFMFVASDFINDTDHGTMTVHPCNLPTGVSAKGIGVMMILAYPKEPYLKKLGMTDTGLYTAVVGEWQPYFKMLQADARVKIVDSFAPSEGSVLSR